MGLGGGGGDGTRFFFSDTRVAESGLVKIGWDEL